jgi:hypothetical protein
VRRLFEWFSRLNLLQKALALLFAALFLFSLSYLVSTVVFNLGVGNRADSPVEEGAAPNTASPAPSPSASAEATVPNNALSITGARWEGEMAVVEGTWKGDVSSVHCDLLEGGTSGEPTRWWDRSLGTRMDWSARTFTQEFVAAGEGTSAEPLDPVAGYGVICSGQFSGGWSMNDDAPVEGTAPAEADGASTDKALAEG